MPRTAGRNLPVATAVAVGLIGLLVASVFWRIEPFVALVSVAQVLALWELTQALRRIEIELPLWPLAVGGVGLQVSAYLTGLPGVLVALFVTLAAALFWLVLDGLGQSYRRCALGTIFAVIYVPLLACFMVLIATIPGEGRWLVLAVIALPVANDTGGYAVGSLIGRHKLVPSISPGKTWEGLGGSFVLTLAVGLAVARLLGHSWWLGLALGVMGLVTATLGDLAESLLKRQLGLKDMGTLLPGHGGILDRVDSILMTAPVAYAVLALV